MLAKVQKWGNSQGLRFTKHILKEAHLSVGDAVEVTVRNGAIVVKTAAQRVRGRYRLKKLVVQMPRRYWPTEEDWGAPAGKEVW